MNFILLFMLACTLTGPLKSAEQGTVARMPLFTDCPPTVKLPTQDAPKTNKNHHSSKSLPTSPLEWLDTIPKALLETPDVLIEQEPTKFEQPQTNFVFYPKPTLARINVIHESDKFEKEINQLDDEKTARVLGTLNKMALYVAERVHLTFNDNIGTQIRMNSNKYKRLLSERTCDTPDIMDTHDPMSKYPRREELMAVPWFLMHVERIFNGDDTQKKLAIRHETVDIICGLLSDIGRPSFIGKVDCFYNPVEQCFKMPKPIKSKKILFNAMHDELLFVIKNYAHTTSGKPHKITFWAEDLYEDFRIARPAAAQRMWLYNTIGFMGLTKNEKRLEKEKQKREKCREQHKKSEEEILKILTRETQIATLEKMKKSFNQIIIMLSSDFQEK